MAQGWDYDRAHADSSKLEYHSPSDKSDGYCRHHPEQLHEALVNEGW